MNKSNQKQQSKETPCKPTRQEDLERALVMSNWTRKQHIHVEAVAPTFMINGTHK